MPFERWDYSRLVPREWQWPYQTESDHGTIHLAVSSQGLVWRGNTFDSRWAGDYTIGLQSFEDFLARGASLLAYAPLSEAEVIRDYLLHQRVEGPPTALACSVILEPWRLRKLQKLSAYLNGHFVFSAEHQAGHISEQRTFDVFAGTVVAGKQEILLSWAIHTEHPNKHESFTRGQLRANVRPGEEMRLVLRLSDTMDVSLHENPPRDLPITRSHARASMSSRAALRKILDAMDEWDSSGDAMDHGAEAEAEKMRQRAIHNLEQAFLASPPELRTMLPDLWALVEVGAAHAVFERQGSGHRYREQVEKLRRGE